MFTTLYIRNCHRHTKCLQNKQLRYITLITYIFKYDFIFRYHLIHTTTNPQHVFDSSLFDVCHTCLNPFYMLLDLPYIFRAACNAINCIHGAIWQYYHWLIHSSCETLKTTIVGMFSWWLMSQDLFGVFDTVCNNFVHVFYNFMCFCALLYVFRLLFEFCMFCLTFIWIWCFFCFLFVFGTFMYYLNCFAFF